MTVPKAYSDRIRRLLGDGAEAYFSALEKEPVRALRILPERMNARLFEEYALSPVPYAENAWYFSEQGVGDGFRHRGGAFYVQEPSAMAPVAAIDFPPDAKVLDLCAAPGGKALQAAARLGEEGVLVANEVVFDRALTLLANIERLGVRNAAVLNRSPEELAAHFGTYFDLVLCDAPCSGEGMMRKNPAAIAEWSEENVRLSAARQSSILRAAARLTAPGGTLLYSTCTFSPEENEEQIVRFLSEHPDFSPVSPKEAVQNATRPGIGEGLSFCRRFYPHIMPGEGQFFAAMKKDPSAAFTPCRPAAAPPREAPGERLLAESFLKETLLTSPEGRLLYEKDGWYLAAPVPLPEKGVIAPGCRLGEVRKGRFVPHHAFFMAFAARCKNRLELSASDPRAEAFLRGEEIAAPFDGWGAVLCENTPLGGVKASGGRGKNHLPKGIRKHV